MDFRILGSLEAAGESGPVTISAPKQRALLTLLLIHVGEVISVDRLIDALWGGEPPRTAPTSLQNLVAQLRQLLGADVLVTQAPGYVLNVPPENIDAVRFERALATARDADPALRVGMLRDALSLWRGAALADVAYESFASGEAHRLEELRLEATELRIAAELAQGGGSELVAELESLTAEHPLHEGLRESLMLALYRAGRQAEALDAFHAARGALGERIGIEPGPKLQAAYRAILRQQAPLAARERESEHDQLGAVAQAMRAGKLVVVLGPTTRRADESGNTASSLAAALSARFGCPPERAGDLARVGQYIALTQGLGPLYDELHRLHDRDDAAGPLERALTLAAVCMAGGEQSAPPLFVTAAFDEALEQALEHAGVPFDVVSYLALGNARGRFVHRLADGSVEVIALPNAYAGFSAQRVVVLKLHGGVDRVFAREWESYVVSEDDHIEYLAQGDVAAVLPVALAARLRRSHFLFLGYPLQHWSLRVFLQRVFSRDPLAYRSWAVSADPDELERELWAARGVHLVAMQPEAFAAALAQRLEHDSA
jgi:DNA-binding SARP family transcriptional activator